MMLPLLGLIAMAEVRPLSCRPPWVIGLGPIAVQTVPVRVMAVSPCRRRHPARRPLPRAGSSRSRGFGLGAGRAARPRQLMPLLERTGVGVGSCRGAATEATLDVLAMDLDWVCVRVARR